MILEFNVTVAKAWFIVLFVCFVLVCIIDAWLGITCNKKNIEIQAIERKTKARTTDYYNKAMQELSNNIHSFNAQAREKERQDWRKERDNLIRKLESENPFSFKFEIGQVVYIFKDNRIYKDKIKEIKVNEQGKKYTGIKLKDIKENNIYATFDDLCNDNKLNKDDIMMYAYNNDIDKRK